MEKIAIVAKKELSKGELEKKILDIKKFEINNENPNIVFTFGGDGTFLEAISQYGYEPLYIPINMGNLGFYTSWGITELKTAIADLEKGKTLNMQPLNITYCKEGKEFYKIALNEVTIINPMNTQILDVEIDGHQFEKFRGTGVCVSTPTGSTAYNKSLGGSLIDSKLELMQYTKMAPINNRIYRSIENSIILGKTSKIVFTGAIDDFTHSILTIDHSTVALNKASKVEITLAEEKIKLQVRDDNSFWKRIKGAFL